MKQYLIYKNLIFVVLCLSLTACSQGSEEKLDFGIKHVLMIGVDGMSPDGVKGANTPVIDSLIRNGASTFHARNVIPTSSGPNWASILMGAGPNMHGVTNNSFNPKEPSLSAIVNGNGDNGLFPTVFEVINAKNPMWEIGAIYHWSKIKNLYEEEDVDYFENLKTDEQTMISTRKYISEKKPQYCFVHFDNVDHVGHSFGHGSLDYYKSVEKMDTLIGELLSTLRKNNLDDKTLVVITADHGGVGFGHNESVAEVMEIPFILSGPKVKKGYTISDPVSVIDNSPTVLFALGIERPNVWRGKPIKSAFEGFDSEVIYTKREFYKQPRFTPKADDYIPAGGLFLDEIPNLIIADGNDETIVCYTLNGEEPNTNSEKYTTFFKLDKTTVVKAAKFSKGVKVSNTNTAFYRVVKPLNGLGVLASVYYGKHLQQLPDFSKMKPVTTNFKMYEFTSRGLKYPNGADQVAVKYISYLNVEVAGEYTFYTESDDGSKLFIDDKEIVDSDGNHGVKPEEGTIRLQKGKHKIEVQWYNSGGGLWLQTYVKGPGIPRQILTTQMPDAGLSLHTKL